MYVVTVHQSRIQSCVSKTVNSSGSVPTDAKLWCMYMPASLWQGGSEVIVTRFVTCTDDIGSHEVCTSSPFIKELYSMQVLEASRDRCTCEARVMGLLHARKGACEDLLMWVNRCYTRTCNDLQQYIFIAKLLHIHGCYQMIKFLLGYRGCPLQR